MDLFGIGLGPNVPTVVLAAHAAIAAVFLVGAGRGLAGEADVLAVALSAAIGLMVFALGVSVSRIAARR